MKRRDIIAASAGAVAGFFLGVVVAATPCPPPQVSVSNGTSAATNCPPATGSSYSTNFPSIENPLSEGGKWINGKDVGLDWNNAQSAAGKGIATAFALTYDDDIAVLTTNFAANQYAQGTVHRAPGYSPGANHEIELLLHFQITAHNARGYEVLWAQDGGMAIVRWNGLIGEFTPLIEAPNIAPAVDGDVLRAEIRDGVIKVYKNGSLLLTGPLNTSWTDGQPGIGFWPKPGATFQSYGWKNYTAGSL